MRRFCFTLQVRPELIEEYRRRHARVWPQMLAALRDTGWRDYSLFLREDGLLVGYLETPDFQKALAGMAERPINEKWQREMGQFFEQLEGQRPDQAMFTLAEVFHLD